VRAVAQLQASLKGALRELGERVWTGIHVPKDGVVSWGDFDKLASRDGDLYDHVKMYAR